MIFIFFIYGLAFFTMGMAIWIFPKKDSAFAFARYLGLLAGFGIVHGINEWVDMFMLIDKPVETSAVHAARLVILAVSYFFLLAFGAGAVSANKKNLSILIKSLCAVLLAAWFFAMALSRDFTLRDIWTRYLLGLPGSLLTVAAFFLQIPFFKEARLSGVLGSLKVCAVAFLCYGVSSGLFVKKAAFFPASFLNYDLFLGLTGFPIQVFRSVCAVFIAYAMVRILSVFEWETKGKIKNLLDETQEAYAKLRQLEKARDSFTHMVVHDLNNPLAVVSGQLAFIKMMDEGGLTESQKGNLDMGLAAANEMKKMIDNLLDINKMESDKLKLRYELFSLIHLVKSVAEEMNIVAKAENKSISLDFAGDVPGVTADKELVKRIITNLIGNAVKHASSDGKVVLRVFYNAGGKEFCVKVQDDGMGIPKENQEKIFSKYAQLDDAAARRGHGLGLVFCKMAVEAHGGRIWIEDPENRGCIFCFALPVRD